MRICCIGDIHLISDDDPNKGDHQQRSFFKEAWPTFRSLVKQVNTESPDLVILLGDLVDWYSRENMAFALDCLSHFDSPLKAVEGNHDTVAMNPDQPQEELLKLWQRESLFIPDIIECEGHKLVLINNGHSYIDAEQKSSLQSAIEGDTCLLLFAHVALDHPLICQAIHEKAENRSLDKYVMRKSSTFYETHLQGRQGHMFTGHLHLSLQCKLDHLRCHLMNMGISTFDTNREEHITAEYAVIDIGSQVGVTRKLLEG